MRLELNPKWLWLKIHLLSTSTSSSNQFHQCLSPQPSIMKIIFPRLPCLNHPMCKDEGFWSWQTTQSVVRLSYNFSKTGYVRSSVIEPEQAWRARPPPLSIWRTADRRSSQCHCVAKGWNPSPVCNLSHPKNTREKALIQTNSSWPKCMQYYLYIQTYR